MDTVDLEEMGLIDGCNTFISEIADTQPILYTPDGTISISSEYLPNNGNRVTYVTIPSLVQMVQDADAPEISYLINNNQIRINRSIILNEDNFVDTAENSADENFEVFSSNQTTDCWITPNNSSAAPVVSAEEENHCTNSDIGTSIACTSNKSGHSASCNEDVDPPDKMVPLFCEKCGLKFTSWKLFKKHKLKHLLEKPYKCDSCRESFNYENNLILHMATHNVENPFCPICKKKFSRIAGLKAHILLHEQEESLFCNECGEEFSSSVFLEEHLQEHKEYRLTGSEPNTKTFFKCNSCNAKFETFLERKEHLKDFHKSVRNRKLRKHSYNNRRRRGNNVCEYCTKGFEKPSQLLRHKRIHTGERPFKCELCTRAFNQKGSLQIHMLKHTRERPYVCQYCQGTFSQKGNLQAHIKRLHFSSDTDERNFKCKLCSCVFRKLGSLNAHFTKAHTLGQQDTLKKIELQQITDSTKKINSDSSDTSNKENELEKTDDGKKVLVALTNDQEEENIQEVTVYHMKVKKTKLHTCCYCQKEFKRSSDLIRHIRMHTQEKPYKCKICSKGFALSSNLAVHLKTHNGKKGYYCLECNKSFSTKDSFDFHSNEHNKHELIPSEGDVSVKQQDLAPKEKGPHLEEITESQYICLDQVDAPALPCDVFMEESETIIDASSKTGGEEKEKSVEDRWNCKDCSLSFKNISLLNAHRQKHHNEVPYKCMLCPCAFKTSKTLKKHVEYHYSVRKYICEHCGKMFLSEDTLKKHSDSHLPGFPWACPICGAGFKSFDACRRHICSHPKIGPIKYKPMAVDCNEEKNSIEEISFSNDLEVSNQSEQINDKKNQSNLSSDIRDFINSLQPGQHITITASEDGDLAFSTVASQEPIDGQYTIIEEKNLLNSTPTISQKQLYDSSLDNCIFLQQNLEMDSTVIEPAISTFLPQTQTFEKCDVCNLVFANETDYTMHKTIHTQEKPHTCLSCDKSFISALEYEEHMKFHLKKISPPEEGMEHDNIEMVTSLSTVKPQTALLKNISEKKKVRSPWRPPARRLTDEEAKILSAIDSNTASVSEKVLLQSLLEKEKYEHPIQEEPKTPEKHQHRCKYCPKTFKKPSDLIRHLRTHTGERPFQCTSCHKRFSIKSTASSHMKTHTKDRSFSCFVCSKNFATTGSLKIHMRLHTGLKPFSCNLCDAKFRTSGHKKAHMKKHLKESLNESKEKQSIGQKCNDNGIDGHFLDTILKQAEYLNSTKPNIDEMVPVNGVEGSQYLVPLNAQNIVAAVTEESNKSVADYLINIDESGEITDESARYVLSVKDSNDGDGFIVEKFNDDQIILTITKGNPAILSNTNHNGPSSSISSQVCSEKFGRKCDLDLHTLTHELQRDFNCSECAESFSLEDDLRAHKCIKGEPLELALDHDLFLFPPV